MKMKEITFVFENCDYITIDGKYIGNFLVDDLGTYISRIACNAIDRIDYANTIAIEIHKDANKKRYEFGQDQYEAFEQMTFDRFKYMDITSINFILIEDYVEEGEIPREEHYDYYVDWTGDNDFENDAQKIYISRDGHLYLVIAKDKGISDFFDIEEINDSEYVDFHFDMCDVGDEYGNPDRYNKEELGED